MPHRSNPSRLRIAVCALVPVLALSGCGGGGGAEDETPLATPSAPPSAATLPASTSSDATASERPGSQGRAVANPSTGDAATPVQATVATPAEPAASAGYTRVVHVDASASEPGDGSAALPYKTIGGAMAKLAAGDDVVVAPGVYREWIAVPALAQGGAPTRIRARTPRTVMVKGSVEAGDWIAVAAETFAIPWSGDEPEQVFLRGKPLQQIGGTVFGGYVPVVAAGANASDDGVWPTRIPGGAADLLPESFTYDAAARRLYVRTSSPIAASERLEVSARRHVLQAEQANGLVVEGLDFAHANTSLFYRWGAVKVVGNGNTLRNVLVQDMDGVCVQLGGNDNALLESTVERCGQLGVTGRGWRLSIIGNRITHNNTRGFNKWWEAGGMKLIGDGGVHDAVVRDNVVAFNAGDGIWFDTYNTGNLIEANTTAYNAGFGIHYETSQSGTIRGNRSYGNTMRGIYLSESASTLVEGNAVFGNAFEGIAVVDGPRSPLDATLKPFNNRVIGNTVAWNDIDRNWVQLALPGAGFNTTSDRNAFKSDRLRPRFSIGFMSLASPAFESLQAWQASQQVDLASTEQTAVMPAVVKAALTARKLLTTEALPLTLTVPGSY